MTMGKPFPLLGPRFPICKMKVVEVKVNGWERPSNLALQWVRREQWSPSGFSTGFVLLMVVGCEGKGVDQERLPGFWLSPWKHAEMGVERGLGSDSDTWRW